MIGKIHYATVFGGLSAYILQQGRKLAEVLAASGVRTSSPEEMAADFELQRSMRPGLRRAVEHVSLAWPPGEADKLSNEVMAQAALRYMEQRGIDPAQTQWVLVRHYDQDHPHAHLLLNRVTDTGGVVPDKHSHLRSAEACRKVEAEMGFVDAAKLGAEQTLARAEQMEPVAKNVDRLRLKTALSQALEKHLPTATTMPELQQALATEGIKLKVLLQKGKLQGVVFTAEAYPNLPMKGSEVARSYSGGELRKTLEAQAKQGESVEQERQIRQQAEAERNRQAQQVELQTQAQFQAVLAAALARQLPGATDVVTLQRGLAQEGITVRPVWQADGQLQQLSFAVAAFPGREVSGAALGPAYEPEALSRTLATQAAQQAAEQREAEELRQRLWEQTQQLATLTQESRWAEARGNYNQLADIWGNQSLATAQLVAYQQQAQETVAGRTMLAEETQRTDKHTEQRQQMQLLGQQVLQQTLEERGAWRSWEDYQARVRELGFDLPHHKGTPVELRHLESGETFGLALVQLGTVAGLELQGHVQQEVFEQEKVRMGAEVALEKVLAARRFASEQEFYDQLRPHGYSWEVTATGEQQLYHRPSGRQIRLAELEPYGQPPAPQVQAAVASQQAALRRGRLEVAAGPEGSAAERAEYLGRQLTAAGAQVESITPPVLGGRAELTYRYEGRGLQAMPVNQALQQLQATAGVLVREQDQGFHQPASEWPLRAGQVGQALVLLYDNEQRPAADRVAAATRLLEEKGAQVGPARSHPGGSVELAISYQNQHPDFAALSQRLDQWNERDDIDVVETDYGRSLRAPARQATAVVSGLSSEEARPGRSVEPTLGKETEIDFDD